MSDLLLAAATATPMAAAWSLHLSWMRRQLAAARRDPLTGLASRKTFEAAASRLLRKGAAAVVVVDLDGFKAVNDTYGHVAGDHAISRTGERLMAAAGGQGLAARLGGDEFALAVPLASPDDLPYELDRLHASLCCPLRYEGRSLPLGASIGALWTGELPVPDLSRALRRADEAMYAAKRTGGGWLIAHGPDAVRESVNGRRAGRDGTHQLGDIEGSTA